MRAPNESAQQPLLGSHFEDVCEVLMPQAWTGVSPGSGAQPSSSAGAAAAQALPTSPVRRIWSVADGLGTLVQQRVEDSYREAHRRKVRVVFNFVRWKQHRSSKRYLRHLLGAGFQLPEDGTAAAAFDLPSKMVMLAGPLLYVMSIATCVACYHALAEAGYIPQASEFNIGNNAPFSLTSFALSLLLVFRTNASYSRFLDARKAWGLVLNRSRDLVRQGLAYFPPDQPVLRAMLCRWVVAFSWCLMCSLREDGDEGAALRHVLPPAELAALLAADHRPNYALQVLSSVVCQAQQAQHSQAQQAQQLHSAGQYAHHSPEQAQQAQQAQQQQAHQAQQWQQWQQWQPAAAGLQLRMDTNLTHLEDSMGTCERILRTPIPLAYTRHTSRFMIIWLTLLPFTLWDSCKWAMLPMCAIIAFLLLGIEEIGVSIEEPFSILPLEHICRTIERNVTELHIMHSQSRSGGAGFEGQACGRGAAGLVAAAMREEQQMGSAAGMAGKE